MADLDDLAYTPERITANDLHETVQQLQRELYRISGVIDALRQGYFPKFYVAPTKLRDGMTRYADGTSWNPGSGEGVYTYYNSTWNKLG